MGRYTDTEMGFTAELKVNPSASIEKDEALEKWLESLNKKLETSQELFEKSVKILDSEDEMDKLKAVMQKLVDDIKFMLDMIEKYADSKGISLRRYFRDHNLDFKSARNVLVPDEEKIGKDQTILR